MPHHVGKRSDEELLGTYLDQVASFELLSKEDEVQLAQAIERGQDARVELARHPGMLVDHRVHLERLVAAGDEAAARFIEANLRLVISIAKRHQDSGVPLLDLIQDGNLGLMHAVGKFDWRKGFKFSTYATWWIKQAISGGIANNRWSVRLPVEAVVRMNQLRSTAAWLEARNHRRATRAELAQELGLDRTKLEEITPFSTEPLSLSGPVQGDADTVVGDLLADPHGVDPVDATVDASVVEEVHHLLAFLDRREREILRLRFGLDRGEARTLREVAAIMHLTSERVRQLEYRALTKLRHPSAVNAAHDLLTG